MKTSLKLSFIAIVIFLLIQLLLSCEPISAPKINSVYVGSITYSLPSINQTTPASRTFRNDSVIWWTSKNVSGQCRIVGNCYQIDSIVLPAHSSCDDTTMYIHSGTGCFRGDSLIEEGTVIYYRKVGVIEIIEQGTFNGKFKKI